MIRELRRQLLLRAHTSARRFHRMHNLPMSVEEIFVAAWLLGWRAGRKDTKQRSLSRD